MSAGRVLAGGAASDGAAHDKAVARRVVAGRVLAGRVLVWGDVIDDIIVRPDGPLRPDTDTTAEIVSRPGGSAANVACWLGSLGVPVDFVGRVGEADADRHAVLLAANGVTPHLIVDRDRPTGTIVILLDASGGRTMLTQRGANAALSPDDIPDELLFSAAICHVSGYSVFNALARDSEEFPRFVRRAHTLGTRLCIDPGSAGYLRDLGPDAFLAAVEGVDVLLPNRDEAAVLTGVDDPEWAARLLGELFPAVAVTAGESGIVVVADRAAPITIAIAAVTPIDPTGAGDAFDAGFVAALLRGSGAVEAARSASVVASGAVEIIGGRPAIASPTLGG